MKIKLKAPLIVAVVALLTSAVSAYSSYSSNARMVEGAKKQELRTTATLIQTSIAEQSSKAAARAALVTSLPSIQEAFRARDREQLIKRLVPAFLDQRERYGVREGQFHLAPAISYLRVFDVNAGQGEDLSSFREMVLATNRRHEPQKGVEIGRRGLSIRGVVEVKDAEGPMGSFEVGMSFTPVLEETKKTAGYDVAVFVDDKLMSSVATLIPRPDQERIIGGFQNVEATNWQAVKPLVTPELLAKATDVVTRTQTVGGSDFGVVVVPLLDYKGSSIGSVVAVRRFDEFQTQSQNALARLPWDSCRSCYSWAPFWSCFARSCSAPCRPLARSSGCWQRGRRRAVLARIRGKRTRSATLRGASSPSRKR
jgi:hypothetical protein